MQPDSVSQAKKQALTPIQVRVSVSMVSLKWADVLSAILPGAVAVLAVAPWVPPLWELVSHINEAQLATGVAFLFASAVAGGMVEAITRISWERWLNTKCKLPRSVLSKLTVANLPLYERSVDSSYKYVTFYANLAWAVLAATATFAVKSPNSSFCAIAALLGIIGVLLRASFVQWTYFVNYQTRVFCEGASDVTERSTGGDKTTGPIKDSRGHQDAGGAANGDPQDPRRVQD